MCDRFVASDVVYHDSLFGIGRADTYSAYCESAVRAPDLTLFVDVPPKLAYERKLARGSGGQHRWDALDAQKRIYDAFQEVLFGRGYPWLGEVVRIDNTVSLEEAAGAALAACFTRLGPGAPESAERP